MEHADCRLIRERAKEGVPADGGMGPVCAAVSCFNMKMTIRDYFGPLRPPFLIINLSCVAAGAGAALWRKGSIRWIDAVLALAGAVCAHAAVNALNEYSDFHTGIDARTVRTPFSGGSGTLQKHPEMSGYVLGIGLLCAAVTAAIGLYFTGPRAGASFLWELQDLRSPFSTLPGSRAHRFRVSWRRAWGSGPAW
jgi:hypothetical protein